jgi:hypothetical protein
MPVRGLRYNGIIATKTLSAQSPEKFRRYRSRLKARGLRQIQL